MEIDFYMYLYSKRVLGCLASVFQSLLPFTGATQLQTFFFVAEGVEQGQGNIPPVWGLLCLESLTFISRNSSMGSWDMTCSMHLLQVCGLPLLSLSWSFHGEKLSSGTGMSVLDKGLSSVRFPRDQRTGAGYLFYLALSRAKIEQISDKLLEPMSRPWAEILLPLIYQCVLNRAWWWVWRGSAMEAQLQFPAQFWSKALGSG